MNGPERPAPEIETLVERRRTDREPLVVRVAYATVDALFSEFSRNINEGGLFIETEAPVEMDARVQLQFSLPGSDEPIKAVGRVVHVGPAGRGGPAGIGIEFEELDARARERIDELVQQLRVDRAR
jgi:uncharacterized protein (TIGR02266 family)